MSDALVKAMTESLAEDELDPDSFTLNCFDTRNREGLNRFYETLSCSEGVTWMGVDGSETYLDGGEEAIRWARRVLTGRIQIGPYVFESVDDLYKAANDGDSPVCGLWVAEGDVFNQVVGDCDYVYADAVDKLDGAFFEWRKTNHPPRTRRLDHGGYVVAWDREDGTPRPLTDAEKISELARLLSN